MLDSSHEDTLKPASYFKLSLRTKNKILFNFFSNFDEGNNTICMVAKSNKKFILKTPDCFEKDNVFDDIRILRLYAGDKQYSGDSELREKADDLLDTTNKYELYLAAKEIFCNGFIKAFNYSAASTYRHFFDSKKNTVYVGSKFMKDFKPWNDVYDEKKQTINGYPIVNGLFVNVDDKRIPIRGLGECAVLGYILGVKDMHTSNWGLIKKEDYYQVVLIDVGAALLNFKHLDNEVDALPQTLINLVEQFYEPDLEGDDLPLPTEAYTSLILQKEIYRTIKRLQKFSLEKIEKLANLHFTEFPFHAIYIAKEIKNAIDHLDKKYKAELNRSSQIDFSNEQMQKTMNDNKPEISPNNERVFNL